MNTQEIMTRSGVLFPVMSPTTEAINIKDIAGSLSKTCRYVGHTKKFYSVAEHCVFMAIQCIEDGRNATDSLTALLHDASEAYLCDLPPAVKSKLPTYKIMERNIQKKVHEKWGLDENNLMPKWLADLDASMAVAEQQQAYEPANLNFKNENAGVPLEIDTLEFYKPETAEKVFLELFNDLYEDATIQAST